MFKLITALKYSFSKTSGQRTSSKLILISIAVSVFSLIVVISVMNGLQTSQLDIIRSIESFDLKVSDTILSKEEIQKLTASDVYAFKDATALVSSENNSMSMRVRAIDPAYFDNPRTFDNLFVSGIFDKGLCLSFSTINRMDLLPGESLKLTVLKKGKTATLVPFEFETNSSNTYSCTLSDFSNNTVFMDIDEFNSILNEQSVSYGIFSDQASSKIKTLVLKADPNAEVSTWQEENNAVYSALVLEKVLVYVFLTFIILIILVSLNNSTRRMIKTKAKESTILRSMGLTETDLHLIYFLQALLISMPGCFIGALLGCLFIRKVDVVLNFLGNVITLITGHLSVLSMFPFSAFIQVSEILLIVLGILVLTILFTLIALKEFRKNSILEVLSNVGN